LERIKKGAVNVKQKMKNDTMNFACFPDRAEISVGAALRSLPRFRCRFFPIHEIVDITKGQSQLFMSGPANGYLFLNLWDKIFTGDGPGQPVRPGRSLEFSFFSFLPPQAPVLKYDQGDQRQENPSRHMHLAFVFVIKTGGQVDNDTSLRQIRFRNSEEIKNIIVENEVVGMLENYGDIACRFPIENTGGQAGGQAPLVATPKKLPPTTP
jgi:hypothetical protein